MIRANLEHLDNVDLTTVLPSDQDVLTYDGTRSMWVPKAAAPAGAAISSSPYIIELDRWNIRNDASNASATTRGINEAIAWAVTQGHQHVILPRGTYLLSLNSTTFSAIVLQSNMIFEMAEGCVLQLEANSSPWYRILELRGLTNVKVKGGRLIGDKRSHLYELGIKFVRGGVNPDGSLNNNANMIRSEVIDRYAHPGLLRSFRLWNLPGVTASGYSFFQYKDQISAAALAGSRTNGLFAPASPTGRGWVAPIEAANKMIFTIDITSSPLTDAQISQIRAKVDSQNYTHEWGHGIEIQGSNYIEIEGVEVSHCTGDALTTSWLEYKLNPAEYTQEQMGNHITIRDCDLHHCRRQGISLTSANDVTIMGNRIHHIGRADDGVTQDGIPPMFGIDIESMWSESNIPTWRPELNRQGLELNTRIYIRDNYIYQNQRGHFVNADGINVTLENNTFEGYNVGGISSYANNWYVKYLNNTFIGCELVVKGDNFVNGAICLNGGNVKIADITGAFITNCQIKNGMFYGSSVYGYFGTPTVDAATGTFTLAAPHGMGNGAQVVFEQWAGKVPGGISVDKLYYTVNTTANSFQVSETLNGPPVKLTDAGAAGFNVSRYNYGRCYISNVTVERDWRPDNASTPNFQLLMAGGVIKNVTVSNYDVSLRSPANYAGRPILVEGLTVLEGAANFEGCHVTHSKFLRVKTSRLGGDIAFGSNSAQYTRKITADHCLFQNVGVNYDGNVTSLSNTFINVILRKADSAAIALIAQSYFENSQISLRFLTREKSVTIVKSIFNATAVDVNTNTRLIENTTL